MIDKNFTLKFEIWIFVAKYLSVIKFYEFH